MLKKILLAIAASFLVLIAFIATRPATYTVERSVSVNAPVDVVYDLVSDFHHFDRFSPWARAPGSPGRWRLGPDVLVDSKEVVPIRSRGGCHCGFRFGLV